MTSNSWYLRTLGGLLVMALLCGGCPLTKPKVCRNPKYVDALVEQAMQLYSLDRKTEDLQLLKEAELCKPKAPELYYWIGRIHFDRDRKHDAIDYFEQAVKNDKKHTESRMALGVAYLSLNRWDEAIEQFEQAALDDFFSRPWEAYNNMSWAYLQKSEFDLALVNANAAIKLNKNFYAAYCNRGEIFSRQGDSRKAIIDFKKCIELSNDLYARPHFLLGLEYGKIDYPDKGCEHLGMAASIENAPEREQALEYMRLYNCPGIVR